MKKVSIIDFEGGNLFSVIQACKYVGIETKLTDNSSEILKCDGLILPGVGSFPYAMKVLKQKKLIDPIKEFIKTGKPFMGICLGFQLLFSKSEEFVDCKGLNLIEGSVRKFNFDDKSKKAPQIGWNKIYSKKNWSKSPLSNVKNNEFMYFVHSFYAQPKNEMDILSYTNYESFEYCSSILKDNIFGTQFHPEKSSKVGIEIYKEWSKLL